MKPLKFDFPLLSYMLNSGLGLESSAVLTLVTLKISYVTTLDSSDDGI